MSNIKVLNNVSLYNSITAASGVRTPEVDGFNSKLILNPDPSLNNDQYLIVEPTGTGDIHIRAGGVMDNSAASLRLGGEYNNVLVSDSGHYVAHFTGMKDTSGNWHANYDGGSPWVFTTEEIVDGYEYKHSFLLPASAHIGNDGGVATWHGNLNILGNLNLAGSATFHNTEYTTTSSISVTNNGTGPALVVNQTGEQAIAAFYDDNSIAFYIDGKTGTGGYVGVGTETPNEKLTVVGNISSTGTMYVSSIGNDNYNWAFNKAGDITFPILLGNQRTGTGENLKFPKTGTQKLVSTSAGTSAQQTVERLVIAGGDSYYNTDTSQYEGEGGDIYLWAGKGYDGGDIKVDAGEGVNGGGTVKIRGAYTLSGTGGFVEVYAGDSSNGTGGPVDIHAGCGPLGGGNITLQTCEGGTHQLVLSSTGELITPYNLVVNGSVYATGGIVGASSITKFVSSFGDGVNTSYTINHNFGTEDVVVSIIDTATKEVVYPSVVNYSSNSIKVEFSEAPALTAYKAVIIG